MPVRRGEQLPPHRPAAGTLFVLGDCAGVYWSDGVDWHPVERTHDTGLFPMDITVRDEPPGTREMLLLAGPRGAADRIAIEHAAPRKVRFVLSSDRLPGETAGPVQRVPANGTMHVNVVYDARQGEASVSIGAREVLGLAFPLAGDPVRVAGRDLPGDVRLRDTTARFCALVTHHVKSSR
jgi:hypothetical protein